MFETYVEIFERQPLWSKIRFYLSVVCLIGCILIFGVQTLVSILFVNEGKCKTPVSELCYNMGDAAECGVIPYCIHCKWATAFNPSEDPLIHSKCKNCKGKLKGYMKKHNGKTPKNVNKMCDLHEMDEDKSACRKMFHQYMANDTSNPSNLTTLDICSLLGMCYSPFLLEMPEKCNPFEQFSTPELTPRVTVLPMDSDCKLKDHWNGKYFANFDKVYRRNGRASYVCNFKPIDESSVQPQMESSTIFAFLGLLAQTVCICGILFR